MNSQRQRSIKDNCSLGIIVTTLLVVVAVLSVLALCVGRYQVAPADTMKILISNVIPIELNSTATDYNVIMNLRLPRVIAAILVGSALSLAGATYQGLFKNPLVSPDLLGVSSGACVGAAAAILLGFGNVGTQILAFIGGICAVTLTIAIPTLMRRSSAIMLVLSGIIVGGFMTSIIGLMKYMADAETELAEIVYWTLGSIAKVDAANLQVVAPVIIIPGALLMAFRWRINILSLGDNEARTLGVNVNHERMLAILCSTLLTASAVCLSGTIGWIGLIIPHLARLLVGSNHMRLLPATALMGAAFLLVIDTLARTLTGGELPLGILTGFIGAPFFTWVLIRQRMSTE
ncbi:MAG: iron ABC transporter permease [Peptococcaceae bacterium]|jgi:iron complex transport system permease protein|nr:iron ABC transporter permease [Peptococcaceae bacterium]